MNAKSSIRKITRIDKMRFKRNALRKRRPATVEYLPTGWYTVKWNRYINPENDMA